MQEPEQATRPEEHTRHDRRQEEQDENPADFLPASCASEAVDPDRQTEAQQPPGGRPQRFAAERVGHRKTEVSGRWSVVSRWRLAISDWRWMASWRATTGNHPHEGLGSLLTADR